MTTELQNLRVDGPRRVQGGVAATALDEQPSDHRLVAATTVLKKLRQIHCRMTAESTWHYFTPEEWPALFDLVDVCGGMHRLIQDFRAGHLAAMWPSLTKLISDGLAIEGLLSWPAVVEDAIPALCREPDEAKGDFERDGCVNINFLIRQQDVADFERCVHQLRNRFKYDNIRVDLRREDYPDLAQLFDIVEEGLSGYSFSNLTGYCFSPDSYRLAIAMQNLPARGLCWHRDIEWPVEPDAVTVIYSLKDRARQEGGAFLYYCVRTNEMKYIFRQFHEASILRNDSPKHKRIFHAVSECYGTDRSRETMIIQCIKRPN
jgi:hypothetical protein